jgi:hypothetical protein
MICGTNLKITRGTDKTYKMTVEDQTVDPTKAQDITNAFIEYAIKKTVDDIDYIIHKDSNATAEKASVSILTGDGQLDYEAQKTGANGNDISIEYQDPGTAEQPLSVTVSNNAIVITLATNIGGSLTSTANEVKTAIENNTEANGLVSITVPGAGTSIVPAVSQTYLSGGFSGGITITDPTNGIFKVFITKEETVLVEAGSYRWDVFVTLAGSGNRVPVNEDKVNKVQFITAALE